MTTNKYLMVDDQMLVAAIIEWIPYGVIYERIRQGALQLEGCV